MLEARGLSLGHPGSPPVLSDLDIELAPGRWTALTGPNGSGKSTLCLALAGLLEPLRGSIAIDGRALDGDPRARRQVAMLFQEPETQLVTGSVLAELAFPLENLGWAREDIETRVARLAREFDLEALAERSPHELSGGEKSRLALAAALAAAPRVLLLDEPGVYLGPGARRRMRELLRREVERGLSVLLVTQLEEEWESADRRLRLAGGRLVEAPAGEPLADRTADSDYVVAAPMATGEVVLTAQGVGFTYRDTAPGSRFASSPLLLENIDLELRSGETVLLGGESGSGKTTLLLLLAGALEPWRGAIRCLSCFPGPPLAVALQSPEDQLVSGTVLEDVALAPEIRHGDPKRARRLARSALEQAGLADPALEARPPSALSHGQRRRVAWAGVWASGASIWLMDEPTAGLDLEGVLALRNAIQAFNDSGGAAVVVNQDPRLTSWPARRLVLEEGKLRGEPRVPASVSPPTVQIGSRMKPPAPSAPA